VERIQVAARALSATAREAELVAEATRKSREPGGHGSLSGRLPRGEGQREEASPDTEVHAMGKLGRPTSWAVDKRRKHVVRIVAALALGRDDDVRLIAERVGAGEAAIRGDLDALTADTDTGQERVASRQDGDSTEQSEKNEVPEV